MNSLPVDQSHHLYLMIYDQLPPAFKRIGMQYAAFEARRVSGEIEEIYPSRAYIAMKSNCSEERVKDFIEHCEKNLTNLVISHTHRKGKRSNHYKVNTKFFESMFFLKFCGMDRYWKERGKEIIQKSSEDQFFLARIFYKKWLLMNSKITREFLAKLPTINSLLKEEIFKTVRTQSRAAQRAKKEKENPSDRNKTVIRDIPLSEKDREWVSKSFAFFDLRSARDAYHVYTKTWGKTVNNPIAFLQGMAKKSFLARMKIK